MRRDNGPHVATSRTSIIHYSKKGTHIVPRGVEK
ncbi:polymorphic toxin type 50 domain-containing protein [Gordonibacter sp. Marseille-P4307]